MVGRNGGSGSPGHGGLRGGREAGGFCEAARRGIGGEGGYRDRRGCNDVGRSVSPGRWRGDLREPGAHAAAGQVAADDGASGPVLAVGGDVLERGRRGRQAGAVPCPVGVASRAEGAAAVGASADGAAAVVQTEGLGGAPAPRGESLGKTCQLTLACCWARVLCRECECCTKAL